MKKEVEVLLVVGGHWFDRVAFYAMVKQLETHDDGHQINWTIAEQPQAQEELSPEKVARYDTILFYDMPGVTYVGGEKAFEVEEPSEVFKDNFRKLLQSGKGLVFLHHAIASWPLWDEYAQAIGGRFHFLPGKLEGQKYPGSGYRFNMEQTIKVLDTAHPIVKGLAPSFNIQDEVYMYVALEDKVTPLLKSDFEFQSRNFQNGGVGFKDHPTGSSLVGWVKTAGNSPIVYLQFGHGPQVYQDPNFKSLIVNSLKWAVSDEAQIWALSQLNVADVWDKNLNQQASE